MRSSHLLCMGLALVSIACGPYMGSPLVVAVRVGDEGEVRQLLKSGADPDRREGVNDWTPLMHAVHKNRRATARALIEGGAKLDEPGPHNRTALIMAAGYGQEEMVRLLLKAGADARLRDVHGLSALDAAVTGVVDLDATTVMRCQTGAVKALLDHNPALTVNEVLWSRLGRTVKSLAGCDEVIRLVDGRRGELLRRR